MQRTECANRETIAHDRTNHPVPAIFLVTQAVSMLDARVPSSQRTAPGADVILDSNIAAKNLIAPAVVIARDPQNGQAGVAQLCKRRKRAKAASWYHRFPLEPEVEEIAVDDKRAGLAFETAKECNESSLDVERGDAQVSVGDDVAWRGQHSRIVAGRNVLHKPPCVTVNTYLIGPCPRITHLP